MDPVLEAARVIAKTQWATRFTDSCIVKRQTGVTFNNTTGQNEPTYITQYDGPCQVRPRNESDALYGQQLVIDFDHVVHLPWDEDDPLADDLVDITSATDGKLNGKTFVVRGIPTDTLLTVRRLFCQDNQSG